MQVDQLTMPQNQLRQQKKARTYVQNLTQSSHTQDQQNISNQNVKRSQIKMMTTLSNTKNSYEQNENLYKMINQSGNIVQNQQQKRDKFHQIPMPSNLYEPLRRESQSLLQSVQISTNQNGNQLPIDFTKFMINDAKPQTGISNKLKKLVYKQIMQGQLASNEMNGKLTQSYQFNTKLMNQTQQMSHRSIKASPRGVQPVSQVNLLGLTQSNVQSMKSLPLLSSQYSPKQDSFSYKQSKVSSTTLISEKCDFSSQARSYQKEQLDQQQCFVEIKDKIFQIKRLLQERFDTELSNPKSAILLLLQKKGYSPSCISFYFSKLIESTIQNYFYQQAQSITPFQINYTNNQLSSQNSIKLEGISPKDSQTQINSGNNEINNDKFQIKQNFKYQSIYKNNDTNKNNNQNNSSFDKDQYYLNITPKNNPIGKGSQTYRETQNGASLLRTKTEESLSHIPSSLPFIPLPHEKLKTMPIFKANNESPYFCSNSVDEISFEEDESDTIISLKDIDDQEFRKRASTESQPKTNNGTMGTLFSQNTKKQKNLFFKMPSQVYDELLQYLLVILKKNISNKVEINYLIKFLNEQKSEYTPQNLVEEFGSVERLHETTKKVFQNLIKEGILSDYVEDKLEFKDDTLLKFINSLVSMDKKKLEYYSQIINSIAKISFAEFYLIKQKTHQSLQQIFDQEERLFLLPLIMESIEKVRYIFLLQRENHIIDDPSLISKVKNEISMKIYIKCPSEYFDEYIAPKIKTSSPPLQQRNTSNVQNNQLTQSQFLSNSNKNKFANNRKENNIPYNLDSFSRYIDNLSKQDLDLSRQSEIFSKQALDVSKQNDLFKQNEDGQLKQSGQIKRYSFLASQSNYFQKSPINSQNNKVAQKENFLSYLISPNKNKLIENNQNYPLKKRFSTENIPNMNKFNQSSYNDTQQQFSKIKQQDNNLNINKQTKMQFFEELTSLIIEKTIVQPDLKELKQLLEQRLVKVDVKIIDFLNKNIEEVLLKNQVQADTIIDVKVRLFKLKLTMIASFQTQYENEEFRTNLQHNFTQIIEDKFKSQSNKTIYVRFIPIFDYIVNNYLSVSDIYCTKDINYSLSFTDFNQIQIKIFKQCVKETFLTSLPTEILTLMDFSESFFC